MKRSTGARRLHACTLRVAIIKSYRVSYSFLWVILLSDTELCAEYIYDNVSLTVYRLQLFPQLALLIRGQRTSLQQYQRTKLHRHWPTEQ